MGGHVILYGGLYDKIRILCILLIDAPLNTRNDLIFFVTAQLAFFTSESSREAIFFNPFSTNSVLISINTTSRDAAANACAMPPPMVPAPTTETFS
jgi:hypothetical protein